MSMSFGSKLLTRRAAVPRNSVTFSRLFVEDSQLMKKNDHNIKSSKLLENFYEVVWQYIASTLKQTSNLQLAKRMENRRLI